MGISNLDPVDGEGCGDALNALLRHLRLIDPQPESFDTSPTAQSDGVANNFRKGDPGATLWTGSVSLTVPATCVSHSRCRLVVSSLLEAASLGLRLTGPHSAAMCASARATDLFGSTGGLRAAVMAVSGSVVLNSGNRV